MNDALIIPEHGSLLQKLNVQIVVFFDAETAERFTVSKRRNTKVAQCTNQDSKGEITCYMRVPI
jgi:hypothetical protein